MYCSNVDVTKLTLSQRAMHVTPLMIHLQEFFGFNDHPSLFMFPRPIDTIDLRSLSNISTLQTQPSDGSSNLSSNQTPNETSDTQEVDKSKETIEPSYYKYLSHIVENYDHFPHSYRAEYKRTWKNINQLNNLFDLLGQL